MTTSLQLQIAAKKAESDRIKALEAAGIDPATGSKAARVDSTPTAARTFLHTTAGSTTIMPDGRRLDFNGPRNGIGEITTTDPGEIEWLADLAKSRTSQVVERVEDPITHEVELLGNMNIDEVAKAAADAAANSERAVNPALVAATEALGKTIAAGG